MNFTAREMQMLVRLSVAKTVVRVTGANYMGQSFETKGIIVKESNQNGAYNNFSKRHFILFLGQVDEINGRKNALPIYTDFHIAKGVCVDKICDMSGNVLFENADFQAMRDDRRWEVNKLYGFNEIKFDDPRGRVAKLIGKPVIIKGEQLTLLAVGSGEDGADKFWVSGTDGRSVKHFEVDEFMVSLDVSARNVSQRMRNNVKYTFSDVLE